MARIDPPRDSIPTDGGDLGLVTCRYNFSIPSGAASASPSGILRHPRPHPAGVARADSSAGFSFRAVNHFPTRIRPYAGLTSMVRQVSVTGRKLRRHEVRRGNPPWRVDISGHHQLAILCTSGFDRMSSYSPLRLETSPRIWQVYGFVGFTVPESRKRQLLCPEVGCARHEAFDGNKTVQTG